MKTKNASAFASASATQVRKMSFKSPIVIMSSNDFKYYVYGRFEELHEFKRLIKKMQPIIFIKK